MFEFSIISQADSIATANAKRQHVQDMCKAIRIEEGLRCLRTPGVSGPKKRAAVTPPLAALMMKLPCSKGEDDGDKQTRPGISLVQREHLWCACQPRASRHSAKVRRRHVNIGVSRNVKQLALVSRSS